MFALTEALTVLADHRTDEVVIATMSAGVLWPPLSKIDRDLGYFAPMGSAGPIGLGLAIARPDVRVIVLDGDGSLLMNLGVLVTIAGRRPPNLLHVVFSNGKYDVTGGQSLPGRDDLSLAQIARAAGIEVVHEVDSAGAWADVLALSGREPGCRFVEAHVHSSYDFEQMKTVLTSAHTRARHAGEGFWNLARSLASSDEGGPGDDRE